MALKFIVYEEGKYITRVASDEEALTIRVQGLQGIQGLIGEKGDPLSVPPQGFCKIDNAYIDSEGNLIVVQNE